MRLGIELYDMQSAFVRSTDRFTVFRGGIGSGKTFAGACKALWECRGGGKVGLIVAPTYRMLLDATVRTYQDVFGAAMLDFKRGDMVGVIRDGSELLFRSADNPETLRGPNIHFAHIDEGALCHKDTWPIVIGRLRADGGAGPCWVTTTPKGRNWLWGIRDQVTTFRAATQHNPYLAPEFVKSLEAAYTGDFARQELAGDYVSFEGIIYDEFSRDVHVCKRDRAEMVSYLVACDAGYVNPSAALAIGADGDGRLHVFEEYYERQVLQEVFIVACAEMGLRYEWPSFYVDPSAAGLIGAMRAKGLRAMAADNAVIDGIQEVKARFATQGDGRPRLTIDPSCVNTIAELESYAWKQRRDGARLDEPTKEMDHSCDALRYACMAVKTRRSFRYASA